MERSIGEIISKCRQDRKLSQEEFATRLGVTPQAVSKWERGGGLPDVALVGGICRVLGISADELLGLDESRVVENGSPVMTREIKNSMFSEPLVIQFGMGLVPCFAEGMKTDYVYQKRKELAYEAGILMPLLHVRDHGMLEETEVQILSYDKVLWQETLEKTDENTFYYVINRMVQLCREHYDRILNKHLVKIMIDNIKEQYPGAAEGLIPERISYLQVLRKLQEVLREKGNIRDMLHILEELEEMQ